MFKLSIIILSYNTKELTISCISSIEKQYQAELNNNLFEIIILDNNSSDDSVNEISKRIKGKKNIRIISSPTNLGFSKGNNMAAKEASGEYLLFLNSDTEIIDRGLTGMIKFLDVHGKVGILGGRLENLDCTNQLSAGKFLNIINLALMLFGGTKLIKLSPQKESQVDWVSGASFMIRKDLFKSLSGFDEKIFMYTEDMDLCFQAKKSGFLTFFYPDVRIIHKESASSNRSFAIGEIYKGILYFYKKNKNYLKYCIVKVLLLIKAVIVIIIGFLTLNRELRKRYFLAIKNI